MSFDCGLKVRKEALGEITTCVVNLSSGYESEPLSFETAEQALADIERRQRAQEDEYGVSYEGVIITGFHERPPTEVITLPFAKSG